MPRDLLTDEQVEMEIERLTSSEAVQLARKELRLKYKRRQYMYQLRNMEKRGKQLMSEGINQENMERMLFGMIPEDTADEND